MKLSIRGVLIAGVFGLQLVSVSAIVGSSYLRTEEVLLGQARQIMENVVDNTIDHLKGFLEPAELAADLTQKLAHHNVLRSDDAVAMERYFFEQLYLYAQFAGIYFGTTRGDFFYVNRDEEVVEGGYRTKIMSRAEPSVQTSFRWRDGNYQVVKTGEDPKDRYDPRTRPWYEKAVGASDVIWTDPYIFFTSKEPGITSASAVLDLGGVLRGVVGVDIEIQDISAFLAKLRDQTRSSAFIFNSNGDVIAHPDPRRIKRPKGSADGALRFVQIDEIDEPASRAAFMSLGENIQDLSLDGQRFTTFEMEGETYHTIFAPFPHREWLWYIGVYIREDDYLGAIKKNQVFNLGLAAFIASLACLVGLLVARSISQPMGKLQHAALAIREGDLVDPPPIDSPYIEVRETAGAFARMVEGLKTRDRTNQQLNEDLRHEVEVRRSAEDALRVSENRYRELVNATVDRYWEMDADFRFIYVSDPEGAEFWPTPADSAGKTRWELADIAPGEEEIWDAHRADLEAHRPFRDFRYRSRDGAGRLRYWRISGKPVFDHEGVFQGYIGTGTNETPEVEARQRAEAELQLREERLRDLEAELLQATRSTAMIQLSSALAHELNQPLTATGNYLSALQRIIASDAEGAAEKVPQTIDKALKQTRRAGDIIKGLRDLVERGEIERSPEDINQHVEEACALALRGRSGRGVKLELQLDETLPEVPVNRIQIQQVVLNLVRNSLEAMVGRSPREITLQTRRAGEAEIEVRVCDNGPGLPEEIADTLFRPFVTTKPEGMGLGLSICQSIIEAHGGKIWVCSGPQPGSCFCFSLPLEETA